MSKEIDIRTYRRHFDKVIEYYKDIFAPETQQDEKIADLVKFALKQEAEWIGR